MNVKVKICGIRTLFTAKTAVQAGADYLGFNFVPNSPRYIDPEKALEIIQVVSNRTKIVGVFQNAPSELVNKIASELKLDFVQLHGKETSAYIDQITTPTIKAITLKDAPIPHPNIHYFLLDRIGRQGAMVDAQQACNFTSRLSLFLAGGLNATNIKERIKKVRPFAVDVASGVETNGRTDPTKVFEFINQVKQVNL